MLLKLKKPLLGLNGEPIIEGGKEILMSHFLSNLLASAKESNNVPKFFNWGLELWREHEITIDQTDLDILTAFVKNTDSWTVLGKGRFLDEFKALEKAEENKPKNPLKKE